MDKPITTFNPNNTKLLPGINLIEASAGTGKTYAIAMLVLRFVVEQELDIHKILVVTFTKAATEELKDRIRNRLVETRLAITHQQTSNDTNISNWLNNLDIESSLILARLNKALMDIDQAGIFTIHGFCQRILTEHALESGQLFDSELTGDISAIEQACCDDFWRQHMYTRSAWEASLLRTHYPTPDELLASVFSIASDTLVLPDVSDLDQKFSELKYQLETSKSNLTSSMQILGEKLAEGKFKKSFADEFAFHSQNLADWLTENSTTPPDFSLFTEQGILDLLNGHKFRKSKANPLSSEEQKKEYIASLQIETKTFSQVDSSINNISVIFRRNLLQYLRENVDKKLQQLNMLSFDNLITHLAKALQGNNGNSLSLQIQQRFQAALIDEFQDTDQNQWAIFSTLFNSSNHYLYLIGDPKQAIYKFRGADINSYFSAQKHAHHFFTLDHNWRSHPMLVEGINTLFSRNNAFYSNTLNFNPVHAALDLDKGLLIKDNKKLAPLVLWQLDKSKEEGWTSGKAVSKIRTAIINEIIDLLSSDYYFKNNQTLKVQPQDIAILVRSNPQAKEFQHTLNHVGITAVINSKESVFLSHEAIDLYLLLQAIAQPSDTHLLKQALTLDWFNLDGQQLLQTLNNEIQMDGWSSRFQQYQIDWQKKGLMVMLRNVVETEKIYSHLSQKPQAERRITNLQHIIELLQQAVIDEHLAINKTIDWLHHNIIQANSSNNPSDQQQLRLESDEEAVNIITMHSSKGLEYPIVFCPFLWQRGSQIGKEKEVIKCHVNDALIADLGSEQFEYHRKIALEEELAEDIRVFYVAVTRAKYRCYINWADVRTKEKENNSAMAYLLDFSVDDFSMQKTKLLNYSHQQPSVFEYRLLPTEDQILGIYRPQVSSNELTYKKTKRSLFNYKQMTSYTALSSLSIDDEPEIPEDKAREQSVIKLTEDKKNELPKGSHTGNVLHDLLENIPFNILAENKDISLVRDKSCLRYGLKTTDPEQIDSLLKTTVSTLMMADNIGFSLHQLDEKQCLKEMPFYLPMNLIDVSKINQILKDQPTYQPLSKKMMSGYLTGFIDLICEVKGKYFILDYKSNSLENYDQYTLVQAMREHNYGLQYWIYTLVLHQYLQHRLPHYNYEQHMGGVKYLFLRGMNAKQINSGVYQTKPEQTKIEQLAKLFGIA